MDQETLRKLLGNLLSYTSETEWLEFKTASETMSIEDIGRYFSALSNEANIKNKDRAWLILGISPERKIVGTKYKNSVQALNELKKSVAASTGGMSFIEIHEYFDSTGNRVLLFEIAAAPQGVPIKWKGIAYGREGESLEPLSDVKESIILSQDQNDWSGKKCDRSTVADLDPQAIKNLRQKLYQATEEAHYKTVSDKELLNRLALLCDRVPVNTAILLLGKTEAVNRLMPDKAKVAWKFSDETSGTVERFTFEAPLLNRFDDIERAINRFNVSLKEATLFRKNLRQYEDIALRELLVNAIAHRDWSINLWIEIRQTPTAISFVNPGIFRADLFAAIENNERPPYLNKKLADLLQKMNLMEREGGGLRKVYKSQLTKGARVSHKFSRSAQPSVEFVLHGQVEDPDFARLVLNVAKKISFSDLLLLDQIRRGRNKVGDDLTEEQMQVLKDKGYIEVRGGRSKRVYISASFSQAVGKEPEYTTSKSLPRDAKVSIILSHIDKFGKITASQAVKIFAADRPSTTRALLVTLLNANILARVMPDSNRANWFYIRGKKKPRKNALHNKHNNL